MCGIAGYVGPHAEGARQKVQSMLTATAHRGPDDSGLWNDEMAMLGHRRLSIIDMSSAGHQPMVSASDRHVLTYNGEIYNYLELRRELALLGTTFRGGSDSEVLLAAFETWGQDCVSRFNGMWAFAIWDRYDKKLFVSRDRFGEKPFYYVASGNQFWFASEIKALLAAGVVNRTANPMAVADFAMDRVTDHTEQTFFANVKQLLPATRGWVKNCVLSTTQYWSLPEDGAASEPIDIVDEVSALLEDAVRLRLRSDVDVGVLLSGGLDSSSVACLAASAGHQIAAFSTIDRQPPEEAAGIDQVLDMYTGLRLHRDTPPDDTLDQNLTECLWHQEEPFADGSMLAHFRLMRRAREEGIRVLLTGQAADEVFAGYPGYQSIHVGGMLRNGDFASAYRFIRAMKLSNQPIPVTSIVGYALPARLSGLIRRSRAQASMDWLVPDWREASSSVADGYAVRATDPVNAALRACLKARTVPGFLHYEDRNAMAFGVETRIPFLDYRLVEKVLPLPAAKKLAKGRTKAILRDAVSTKVPHGIVQRLAKQGYPAPLGRWLRALPSARRMEQLEVVSACPMIAGDRWRARYAQFLAGDESQLPFVWRGLILALWHERFIANKS
jgi:asparagine synthase (glutamine-hydrolysing)